MEKLIAAIFGEGAVETLLPLFEKLTDEQKYDMLGDIVDAISDALKGVERLPRETMKDTMQGMLEHFIGLMPSLKEKLEGEVEKALEELKE
jgi:hypothetical protein